MSNSASSFTGVSSGYTAGTPVPADSPIRDNIADAVRRVRETTPLAQSFTNFVTINLVANAQLAAGGTAAMSFLPDDVIETAKIAGANYINVGTLLPFYKDALPEIAQRLNYLDKPWVLDPVAAGIGRTRTAILQAFKAAPPTMIRANASEVIALANMWGLNTETVGDASEHRPAGVESVDDVESATGAAVALAQYLTEQHAKHSSHDASTRCAVAVSGIADLVTDGENRVPTAGRQRDDDQDHRCRLLAGRRGCHVFGGLRSVDRRPVRVSAVQPRGRGGRYNFARTGLVPSCVP